MIKSILKTVNDLLQFPELDKKVDKKYEALSIFLKSIVVLGAFGLFYVNYYLNFYNSKVFLIFDSVIIVLSIYLGSKLSIKKVSAFSLIEVLYVVVARLVILFVFFKILLQISIKIFSPELNSFPAEQVGFHVLLVSLIFLITQMAFSKR